MAHGRVAQGDAGEPPPAARRRGPQGTPHAAEGVGGGTSQAADEGLAAADADVLNLDAYARSHMRAAAATAAMHVNPHCDTPHN